jgi:site-specific DNA recombinase
MRYADEARTGTNDDREQFQRMIADSGKNMFSIVLVHKIDRFFRDLHELLYYQKKLRQNGVSLMSVSERIDDSPQGQFMFEIMGSQAQLYSRNLSTEIKKGQRETALQGLHVGGFAPLGYDVDPATRKYIRNEYESLIVRVIFDMYASGNGYSAILDYLNSMGYRTKRGNLFGKNSLLSILSNEKYIGRYIYNKRQEKDFLGNRNPIIRPKEEWITIEDGLPAIIDKETFDRAQARMAHNSARAGCFKAKYLYLLTGLIRCGECGATMHGNARMDGRKKSFYISYTCANKHHKRGCDNPGIRKERVETFVLDELYDKILSEVSIRDITERLNAYNAKMAEQGNGELQLANKELISTRTKIDRLLRLVTESGVSSETVSGELKRLEEAKTYLESRISGMEVNKKIAALSEDITKELLLRSREAVRRKDIPECRNLIPSFVESVAVYKDRVDVSFKIQVPDGDNGGFTRLRSEQPTEAIRHS